MNVSKTQKLMPQSLQAFIDGLTLKRLLEASMMVITGDTLENASIFGVHKDEVGEFALVDGGYITKIQLTGVPGVFLVQTIGEVADVLLKEFIQAIAADTEIMAALSQLPIIGLSPVGKKPVSGYIIDMNSEVVIGLAEDDQITSIEIATGHQDNEIVLLGYDGTKLEFVSTYNDGRVDGWSSVEEISRRLLTLKSRDVTMQIDIGDSGFGLYANGEMLEGTELHQIEQLRYNPSAPKAGGYAVTSDGHVIAFYLQGTDVTHSILGELRDDEKKPIADFGDWSIETGRALGMLKGIGFIGFRQTEKGFEGRRFQAIARQ